MTAELSPLVIDSREPADIAELVARRCGPPVERLVLPTSDFMFWDRCGCQVGIERKTISDFLGSMTDNRLVSQLTRLRDEFAVPILLLEDSYGLDHKNHIKIGQRPTGWHHAAVQMALFSLQGNGVYVLQTPTVEGTADVIRVLRARGAEKCLRQWDAGEGVPRDSAILRLERPDGGCGAELRPEDCERMGAPGSPDPTRRRALAKDTPSVKIGWPVRRRPKRS